MVWRVADGVSKTTTMRLLTGIAPDRYFVAIRKGNSIGLFCPMMVALLIIGTLCPGSEYAIV